MLGTSPIQLLGYRGKYVMDIVGSYEERAMAMKGDSEENWEQSHFLTRMEQFQYFTNQHCFLTGRYWISPPWGCYNWDNMGQAFTSYHLATEQQANTNERAPLSSLAAKLFTLHAWDPIWV